MSLCQPELIDLRRVAGVISRAFDTLPISIFLGISSVVGTPQSELDEYYLRVVNKHHSQGAVVVESGDYNAVAVWLPPDQDESPPSDDELRKMSPRFREVHVAFKEIAERYGFDKERHWHLQYLARDPLRHGEPDCVSALVRPFLTKAKEDGFSVVLESVGGKASHVYEHWGFEILETVNFGEGDVECHYMAIRTSGE